MGRILRVVVMEERLNSLTTLVTQFSNENRESGFHNVDLDDPNSKGSQFLKQVSDLIKIQSRVNQTSDSVSEKVPAFLRWLAGHGVDVDDLSITVRGGLAEGCGVIATKPIKKDDLLLNIPRKLIISTDNADQESIDTISPEQMKQISSVKLAVYLCFERQKRNSFWKPFIDTLPQTLTLPLFWTKEELQTIKGSIIYGLAIQQIVHTVMQYLHIYPALMRSKFKSSASKFTYADYRWAVAIIMSRQNFVPINGQMQICLIPFWDMFNHSNGSKITTYYNGEAETTQCYAIDDFEPEQQAFIFYGPRSNDLFLLYQGFVYDENMHDCFLYEYYFAKHHNFLTPTTKQLINKNKLAGNRIVIPKSEDPVNWTTMTTMRIIHATDPQRESLLKLEDLTGVEISLTNELQSIGFLIDKIQAIIEERKQTRVDFEPDTTVKQLTSNMLALEDSILQSGLQRAMSYRATLKKQKRGRGCFTTSMRRFRLDQII